MAKPESHPQKPRKIALPKALGFTPPVRGRGALDNPSGRFERLDLDTEPETYNALLEAEACEAHAQIKTEVFRDSTRSIIATNDSPDIGMEATINPYRGCEHGCIYCYARPGHEYFGLSAGLDFESKIFAKPDAATLLVQKLSMPSWKPKAVTLSGVTDCYQPTERKMKIARGCLEVLRDFRNPAAIITKNALVTRDADIFRDMAAFDCIAVNISVTTLDGALARVMEPRASQPAQRLRAIETLAKENIPVGVMIGPVLPGLTEHEIPAIMQAVKNAGARSIHYTMLRLPYGVKDLFQAWLAAHYPDRAEKVLNRLREMRGGKLYDSEFGARMRGKGVHADHIAAMFTLYKKRYDLDRGIRLSTAHFRKDAYNAQGSLF
ncbi:MAG: PA0069 family radical SAM protein [Alphaproteobacteria bacterium]|nr:PA0069 family radical SAM protein [Alphaproteobacteria bacterium]